MKHKGLRHVGFGVLALMAPAAGFGQGQHFATNEELRSMRAISGPVLSPDGKHVVATVQDSTADGGRQHLWLLSVNGDPPRQLTFSEKTAPGTGEVNPEFLPDGSELLYTVRKEGGGRLLRLPMAGGEPVEVKIERQIDGKEAEVSLSSFVVAPKGGRIAVIATDPDGAATQTEKKDKKDAIWFEHDEHRSRLYLLETKTWKAHEVPIEGEAEQISWTEDGGRLLLMSRMRSRDLAPSAVAWEIDANGAAAPRRIEELPETAHRAVWMHDGRGLLVLRQCEEDAPAGCGELYALRFGERKLRNLTKGLKDATISRDVLSAADERTAIVSVEKGFDRGLARVDLESGVVTLLPHAMPVTMGWKRGLDARSWVYLGSSSTSAPAVYLTSSTEEAGRRLKQPLTAPADWKAVPSHVLLWRRAGMAVEGRLYLPEAASASERVPLVVNVHGGPTGAFADSYSPLVNLLVAQGWAVLQTNPRGSTGYGVAFEAANKEDMGNGDFLDIMAGVDEAIRTAPIDESRMALIGYSYGGEMAGFVEGKTTRFRALVSGAPVTDQFSEYGTESSSFGDKWFTGEPWLHFEDAWRQSPLAYARNAKTPLLLLQGMSDTTDPEGQSQEMYRALRQEGVPVQMVLFPREDHGALGRNFAGMPSTEPWHGVTAREHMIGFIRDAFAGRVMPNPK